MNWIFLFRLIAAINAISLEICTFLYMPPNKKYKFNPLGLIYMTRQVNLILTIYFTLSFIFNHIIKYDAIKKRLRDICGFTFSGGFFIGLGYYLFVHFTSHVQETIAKYPVFGYFMFWMHFVPIIMVVLDVIVLSFEGVQLNFKRDCIYIISYGILYQTWSIFCFWINGIWPYPHQANLDFWGHVLFILACILILISICGIGKLLNSLLVKEEKQKKK